MRGDASRRLCCAAVAGSQDADAAMSTIAAECGFTVSGLRKSVDYASPLRHTEEKAYSGKCMWW